MIKKNNSILFCLVALLALTTCGKYEEGPKFSLLTKQTRLVGDYTVDKYLINGIEMSLSEDLGIIEYSVSYLDNGKGERIIEMQSHTLTEKFEWKFSESKEYLNERIKVSEETYTNWIENQKILRLTNKELWVIFESETEEIEIHYSKM